MDWAVDGLTKALQVVDTRARHLLARFLRGLVLRTGQDLAATVEGLDHVWSRLRLWVRRTYSAAAKLEPPGPSNPGGAAGSEDDPAVWAALQAAHKAMEVTCPLSAGDRSLLMEHLEGASGCIQSLADRAYTNQCALAGDDLDALVRRHAAGTVGVPAGVLRRFLAAQDIGRMLASTEVVDGFASAVDKVGCSWAEIRRVWDLARDSGVVFREGVTSARRDRAAAARAERAKAKAKAKADAKADAAGQRGDDGDDEGDSKPRRVVTCRVCLTPGHNRRSKKCPGPPAAAGADPAAEDKPSTRSASQSLADQGRQAGACFALRWHILGAGTKLKGGGDCATVPLPSVGPCEVVLDRRCVPGLLRRALAHATAAAGSGGTGAAASLDTLGKMVAAVAAQKAKVQAAASQQAPGNDSEDDCDDDDCDDDSSDDDCDDDDDSGDDSDDDSDGGPDPTSPDATSPTAPDPTSPTAQAPDPDPVGLEALFNLAHPPLARLLRKDPLPAQVTLSGARGCVHFTVFRVRLTRRLEGTEHLPVRWVEFSPRGRAWAKSAGKRGHNGAGVRTLSTDWHAWHTWTPGPYSEHGVPEGWTWEDDGPGGGSYVAIDPGVRLPLCCHSGLALPAGLWYQHRATGRDYRPKPGTVRSLERSLGGVGKGSRSWGLVSFSEYLTAFYKAWPDLRAHYGSATALGAKAWKGDKLRSLLAQLLNQLAPDPQVPERVVL